MLDGLKKLAAVLKPMTGKERLEHLWDNYKAWLFVLVLLIALAVNTVVTKARYEETVMSGLTVNVTLTDEGWNYFKNEYPTGEKEKVAMYEILILKEEEKTDFDSYYNSVMKLPLLIGAKELDFILLDKPALEQYVAQDLFLDLTEVFSDEQLESMAENIIHCTPVDADGQPTDGNIPIAVNISNLPFVLENIAVEQEVYLAFAGNAPHKDALYQLWEHIALYE